MEEEVQSQRAGVVHVQVGRSRQLCAPLPYQTGGQMDAEHRQRLHVQPGQRLWSE